MNDQAIGKMFSDLERAEAKLTRAFNRWMKLKAQVKRFDKRYAKALDAAVPVHTLPKGGPAPWAIEVKPKKKTRKL